MTGSGPLTAEEAVLLLRNQPESQELVKACCFDDPVIGGKAISRGQRMGGFAIVFAARAWTGA